MTNSLKKARSGQMVVVSALVIALIMTSTAMYIYDLNGNFAKSNTSTLNYFFNLIKTGSKHAVVGALANITKGGPNETLSANLNRWKSTVEKQYLLGTFVQNFDLRSTTPYYSGVYVDWGNSGTGISEAYVEFSLNVSGKEIEAYLSYNINVSTRLNVEGFIMEISSGIKKVTVKCTLFNDGQPALAKSIVTYYRESTEWLIPDDANNYSMADYGNGTYCAIFYVETYASSIGISSQVFDKRDILVVANTTCT